MGRFGYDDGSDFAGSEGTVVGVSDIEGFDLRFMVHRVSWLVFSGQSRYSDLILVGVLLVKIFVVQILVIHSLDDYGSLLVGVWMFVGSTLNM